MKNQRLVWIGALLPVVMVAGFVAYAAVQRSAMDPPAYDLLFTTIQYSPTQSRSYAVEVRAERAVVVAGSEESHAQTFLYRLHVNDMQVEQIPLPEGNDMAAGEVVNVAPLEGLRVVGGELSPDGFSIAGYRDRGPSVFREIFSSNGQPLALWKDGVRFSATAQPNVHIYNVESLGWVVP